MKNRKEIVQALNRAKNGAEGEKILNKLNSCDALWVMENAAKLPKKAQKYLTGMKISVIVE